MEQTKEITPLESWILWLKRRIPGKSIWIETALTEVYKEGFKAGSKGPKYTWTEKLEPAEFVKDEKPVSGSICECGGNFSEILGSIYCSNLKCKNHGK